MSKTLIIAEKPSVATDLQRVFGKSPGMTKFKKEKDYFENDTHIISSAIGHLVELAMPNTADGKKPKWDFQSLPIIPEKFKLEPIEKTKTRLNLLKKLIKRKDVTAIVNACDAGREGELIFRYVVDIVGTDKPTHRLWMQSMTDNAIQEAFKNLRSGEEMNPLADAAICRSESDWLVGINGTRALTAFNSRNGGFRKTPVGRVQTPTLTLLSDREKAIRAFEPRTYFEAFADFDVAAGSYRGRWFDEGFKKNENDAHQKAERLWDQENAEQIETRCKGKTGQVEETKKPQKQGVPLLYDLTSLQREANGRFGFSARRTLQIAQALYEKYKVLTYPRTDSRYLPEDYIGNVKQTLGTFAGLNESAAGMFPSDLAPHADAALNTYGVKPNKRIFNSAKVSDHFAIIPTGQVPKSLDEVAAKLYRLVTQRFIAVFFPAAEFEVTKRITRIGQDAFRTDGKIMVAPGWQAVYGKEAEGEGDAKNIVAVAPGETAQNTAIEVKESQTKPPPHYNEATLLSVMEGAGKLVEDEELAEAMQERGLGTPATRASIIEGLIYDGYVVRDGKDLIATPKGIGIVDQVHEIGVDALSSPELTGQWEYKLKQMEQGKLSRATFMGEIQDMTENIVSKARGHLEKIQSQVFPELKTVCPACGATPLKQTDAHYACPNPECKFRIVKHVSGRELNMDEAKELIEKRFIGPLTGFRSRWGSEFEAAIELKEDDKGKFKTSFVFEGDDKEAEEIKKLTPEQILCDYKNEPIYETETSYALLKNGETKFDKKVRLPKTLCQIEISREQALKFFNEGRTDVIENFISKKGKPFSATLIFQPEGRRSIQWQFPPRAPKKKAAKKAAKKATKKAAKTTD